MRRRPFHLMIYRMKWLRLFVFLGFALGLLGTQGILRAESDETLNKWRLTSEQVPGLGAVVLEKIYPDGGNTDPAAIDPNELDILNEYGFVKYLSRIYTTPQGTVQTTVHVMKDFKAAFGLYTHLKMPGGKNAHIGDGSIGTADEIVFWQSNYCVRIKSQSSRIQAIQQKIAKTLSQQIPHHSEVPVLVTYLPETGLLSKSVHYFLGFNGFHRYTDTITDDEALGFKNNAEAIVADYKVDRRNGKIFLLGYPNHPLAIQHFKALEEYLTPPKTAGKVYTKRSGVIVAILSGDFDQATADKLLGEITYADSVRWVYDKRGLLGRTSASYTAMPILHSVVNSIIFTGLLCIISLSTGVLVGGARFYSRRFRERPREESDPVMIRLNLNG